MKRALLFVSLILIPIGPAAVAHAHPVGPQADQKFHVDTFTDDVDNAPGDGHCRNVKNDNLCSLRAAVQEANALPGLTRITLDAPGTYTLTIKGSGENSAAKGDLDVKSSLELFAPAGESTATIKGGTGFDDRIFDIPSGSSSQTVTFEPRLIVSGGKAPAGEDGGGIRSLNAGYLSLNQMSVKGNTARNGGGVYVTGGADDELNLNLPVFSGNTATGNGGGIDIEGDLTADLTRVTAEDNTAKTGGGIAVFLTPGSTGSTSTEGQGEVNDNAATDMGGGMALSRFSGSVYDVTGNSAPDGGGIALFGTNGGSSFDGRTYVLDNEATNQGGGIYADCSSTCGHIGQFTVQGNTSGKDGGGLFVSGGLAVERTVLYENEAAGGAGGGGIVHTGSLPLGLTNVTVTQNTSSASGSPTSGGVVIKTSAVDMFLNTTIAWNSGGTNRGVVITGSKAPQVKNTIIANQTTGTALCNKKLTSLGHNIDSGNSCGFSAAGDKPNTDPMLNGVTDNGGGNYTMSLRPGAPWPAIDAGDDDGCPPTDERWARRPQDGSGRGKVVCDIGAYEAGSTFKNVQVGLTITASPANPHPGGVVTYTVTFTNGGPFDSMNSSVVTQVPSQLTILTCKTSNGTPCKIQGLIATATFTKFGQGSLPSVTLTAVVGPTTPKGTVLKSLEATWAENPDMNHNNNTGVAIVTVT